jgi:hypothetical protein
MASATGTATVNFGSAPGSSYATVAVTGQGSIGAGSHAEAFLMADATATHNAVEHILAGITLVCGDIIAGTGFTIHATTQLRLTGTFTVRWVWAD